MRWWMIVALVGGAVASIAAVILAISSVSGSDDVPRVKTALQLQTNCPRIAVQRPSRARIVKQWAGLTVQSADIRCVPTGAELVYAKFADRDALDRALGASAPASSYCVFGAAIVIDRLVEVASTAMSDTCQSISGTLMATGG